jgi:hypothetical protein
MILPRDFCGLGDPALFRTTGQTLRDRNQCRFDRCTGVKELTQSINDACLLKIVRRHFKLDAITCRKPNESLPHFSGYMC